MALNASVVSRFYCWYRRLVVKVLINTIQLLTDSNYNYNEWYLASSARLRRPRSNPIAIAAAISFLPSAQRAIDSLQVPP